MDLFICSALAVALIIASITDIRRQRIYNWLTFPLILTGFAFHAMAGGWAGVKFAAFGFTLGFAVMGVPYFLGVMGAGDVKLMAGVGAWLGVETTFNAFLFTSFAGGIYGLGVLAFHREVLMAILRNIKNAFLVLVATRRFNFAPVALEKSLPRLCYGVAIAVGTGAAMFFQVWLTESVHGGY